MVSLHFNKVLITKSRKYRETTFPRQRNELPFPVGSESPLPDVASDDSHQILQCICFQLQFARILHCPFACPITITSCRYQSWSEVVYAINLNDSDVVCLNWKTLKEQMSETARIVAEINHRPESTATTRNIRQWIVMRLLLGSKPSELLSMHRVQRPPCGKTCWKN